MEKQTAKMTVEEKFDALYNAANKAWDGAFRGWEWYEDNVETKKYVLGEKNKSSGFAFFLAGCRDTYGSLANATLGCFALHFKKLYHLCKCKRVPSTAPMTKGEALPLLLLLMGLERLLFGNVVV